MAGEYKSTCGCKIHVAQWTAKRKVVTQESCPLHKNAAELLNIAKAVVEQFPLAGITSKKNSNNPAEDLLARAEEAVAKVEGRV